MGCRAGWVRIAKASRVGRVGRSRAGLGGVVVRAGKSGPGMEVGRVVGGVRAGQGGAG